MSYRNFEHLLQNYYQNYTHHHKITVEKLPKSIFNFFFNRNLQKSKISKNIYIVKLKNIYSLLARHCTLYGGRFPHLPPGFIACPTASLDENKSVTLIFQLEILIAIGVIDAAINWIFIIPQSENKGTSSLVLYSSNEINHDCL